VVFPNLADTDHANPYFIFHIFFPRFLCGFSSRRQGCLRI